MYNESEALADFPLGTDRPKVDIGTAYSQMVQAHEVIQAERHIDDIQKEISDIVKGATHAYLQQDPDAIDIIQNARIKLLSFGVQSSRRIDGSKNQPPRKTAFIKPVTVKEQRTLVGVLPRVRPEDAFVASEKL